MSRNIDTKDYLDTAVALLRQGKKNIPVPVSGTSMTPFLHPGDTVYLNPPPSHFQPGQIVLYTRESGQYILHRIIACRANGNVWITGDRQNLCEQVDASKKICAIVYGATRKGRKITSKSPVWLFYAYPWRWLLPIRQPLLSIITRLRN